MPRYRLTALQVKTLGPGLHSDGGGLYLLVDARRRSWVFIWKRAGKQYRRGLGSVTTRSLAEARRLAETLRHALANGQDPDAILKPQSPSIPTIAEAVAQYIAHRRPAWRNAKHAQQWHNTLQTYALPVIGALRPAEVDLDAILKILTPIWLAKPETASRVRQRLEAVLDYCAVNGWRAAPNPARWRGHLDKILPPSPRLKQRRHFAALPYREAPALWAWLETQRQAHPSPALVCLQWVLLSACRSAEARGARWSELTSDQDGLLWVIPPARTKAQRPHRIPITPPMQALLAQAQLWRTPEQDLLFPSPSRGQVLSDVAVAKVLHRFAPGYTVHGLRATFKTWAAEQTHYPTRVVETALAHVNPDKTEAAYERSDYLAQRRQLMTDWANYLCQGQASDPA